LLSSDGSAIVCDMSRDVSQFDMAGACTGLIAALWVKEFHR
jgi:hypothetical protein